MAASAFADEEVLVDEEIAIEMSSRFFDAVLPDKEIEVGEVVELFNADGEAVGFVAHAFEDGKQQGYVVFDKTEELGVAEFGLGEDAKSPYQLTKQNKVTSRSFSEDVFYRTGYSEYVTIDAASGLGRDVAGNSTSQKVANVATPADKRENDRSPKPEGWNDLFMSLVNVYRDYSITAVNAVSGATAYAESTVEAQTGKYACAVSAALTVCTYYVKTGGLSSLASDYNELWSLMNATVDKVENGITYGSTKKGAAGPAVKTFCAKRGKTIGYNFYLNDSWNLYKNAIDSGNMAITRGNCNDSGHAMAVVGYLQLTDKTDYSIKLNTLMVYDGWYTEQRVLNYGSPYYENKASIIFS